MAENKKKLWDIIQQIMIRQGFRSIFGVYLDQARRKEPETFLALAWIYLAPEEESARYVLDELIYKNMGWLSMQLESFNLSIEQKRDVIQDLPGILMKYFEDRHSEIVFPETYKGPRKSTVAVFNEFKDLWVRLNDDEEPVIPKQDIEALLRELGIRSVDTD